MIDATIAVRFDRSVNLGTHYISLHHIVVEVDSTFQAYLFPLRCRFSIGEASDIVCIEALDLDINASSVTKMNAAADNIERHTITGIIDVFIDTGDLEVDPELVPLEILSFQLKSEKSGKSISASQTVLSRCSLCGRYTVPYSKAKETSSANNVGKNKYQICRKEIQIGFFDVYASSKEEAAEKFESLLHSGQIDLSEMSVLESYNEVCDGE